MLVMKKFFFAFTLSILLFLFLIPQKALATCIGKLNNTCSVSTSVDCFVSGYLVENYCCDSPTTCTNYGTGGTPVTPSACSIHGGCYPDSYVCQTDFGQSGCWSNYKCGTSCSAPTGGGGGTTGSSTDVSKCDNGTMGIQTAIGCIHVLTSPEVFLGEILRWAVGIGGGIAFLLILYAGFMIMTASGNPERLKAGQELLTSAISGLILLVFSIFILKFIGVDILGLCKFGFGPAC
jgi:hypothetical protein